MIIIDEEDEIVTTNEYTFFLESKNCVARAIDELNRHGLVVSTHQATKPHVTVHLQGQNFSSVDYARRLLEDVKYYENTVIQANFCKKENDDVNC